MMFGQTRPLDWDDRTAALQQTANDAILCRATEPTRDEWSRSGCIVLTEKRTVINDEAQFFGNTVSGEEPC